MVSKRNWITRRSFFSLRNQNKISRRSFFTFGKEAENKTEKPNLENLFAKYNLPKEPIRRRDAPPEYTQETSFSQMKGKEMRSPVLVDQIVHFEPESIKHTVLDNGIRVISADNNMNVSAMWLMFKDAGERFDGPAHNGYAQLLHSLCFSESKNFSAEKLQELQLEIMYESFLDKDMQEFLVCASRLNWKEGFQLLSDQCFNTLLNEEDIADSFERFQIRKQMCLDDPAANPVFQKDLMNTAAFGEETPMGKTSFFMPQNVSVEQLKAYRSEVFVPENMALVGIGLDHEEFVNEAKKIQFPPHTPRRIVKEKPVWKGGDADYEFVGTPIQLEKQNIPSLTTFVAGFEICGFEDLDIYPYILLETMLGGGDSFSSGGPGKGLQSLLMREHLGRYPLYTCKAEIHSYSDTGIFSFVIGTTQEYLDFIQPCFADILRNTWTRLTQEDLDRAKNRFKHQYLTQLEDKRAIGKAIGGDYLYFGEPMLRTGLNRLEKVTLEECKDAWKRMLQSNPPALVRIGNIKALPTRLETQRLMEVVDRHGYD